VVENLPHWHALMLGRPTRQPTTYWSGRAEQIRFTGPWFPYRWLGFVPERLRI